MCSQIHNSSRARDEGNCAPHFIHLQPFLILIILTALGLSGEARDKQKSHDSDGKKNAQKRRKHLKREL